MDSDDLGIVGLPELWQSAPRRWGHPLHSLCSYFAMFPPQLASVFIRWLTEPGDAVYDPFAGRGTAPLEAVLHGRTGYGSDANPLAHALTDAKLRIPSALSVKRRLSVLGERYLDTPVDVERVPDHIRMLYAPGTMRQIMFLRDMLGTGPADAFIRAAALGMLHANHSRAGATRGFSISMPNTFAMGPGYVRDYIAREGLVAPEVDVFDMLRRRAERYGLPERTVLAGKAWLHDATAVAPAMVRKVRPRLVFTSPPYLEVIKYGKYNWVRLWFLKEDPRDVDGQLMASASLDRYLFFMRLTLTRLKQVVAKDGFVCLVIGDVRRNDAQLDLAEQVWQNVAEPTGWYRHGIAVDSIPGDRKVSRIWKNNRGRATKTDRVLILSLGSEVALPPRVDVDWNETPSLEGIRVKGRA
jgi:hypothetical protein